MKVILSVILVHTFILECDKLKLSNLSVVHGYNVNVMPRMCVLEESFTLIGKKCIFGS